MTRRGQDPPYGEHLGHRTTGPHHRDGCDGWDGHDGGPADARAQAHEELLAAVSAAIHAPGNTSWATRAFQVRDVLHAAGYHYHHLDAAGRLATSDPAFCPRCVMHPEKLADRGPVGYGALGFLALLIFIAAMLWLGGNWS